MRRSDVGFFVGTVWYLIPGVLLAKVGLPFLAVAWAVLPLLTGLIKRPSPVHALVDAWFGLAAPIVDRLSTSDD